MVENDRPALTPGMHRAVKALLQERTIRDAASAAGLSEATIYRYMRNDAFRTLLRERQDVILAGTTAALVGQSGTILCELYRIAIGGERESVRASALKTWLSEMRTSVELQDLVARIEALETQLTEDK